MNEKKVQKAVEAFCKNPYWKEKYDNAPSDDCKRYIALGFYYSDNLGDIPDYEDYKAEREKLEEKFTKEDWQYLYKSEGNNPRKSFYKKKVEEMQ